MPNTLPRGAHLRSEVCYLSKFRRCTLHRSKRKILQQFMFTLLPLPAPEPGCERSLTGHTGTCGPSEPATSFPSIPGWEDDPVRVSAEPPCASPWYLTTAQCEGKVAPGRAALDTDGGLPQVPLLPGPCLSSPWSEHRDTHLHSATLPVLCYYLALYGYRELLHCQIISWKAKLISHHVTSAVPTVLQRKVSSHL